MLKIPQKEVSFRTQTLLADGSFLKKEISLVDISADEDVEIQYNSETNEVMLVVVNLN